MSGSDGIPGEIGEKGAAGEKGEKGDQGERGKKAHLFCTKTVYILCSILCLYIM